MAKDSVSSGMSPEVTMAAADPIPAQQPGLGTSEYARGRECGDTATGTGGCGGQGCMGMGTGAWGQWDMAKGTWL